MQETDGSLAQLETQNWVDMSLYPFLEGRARLTGAMTMGSLTGPSLRVLESQRWGVQCPSVVTCKCRQMNGAVEHFVGLKARNSHGVQAVWVWVVLRLLV